MRERESEREERVEREKRGNLPQDFQKALSLDVYLGKKKEKHPPKLFKRHYLQLQERGRERERKRERERGEGEEREEGQPPKGFSKDTISRCVFRKEEESLS